NYILSLNGDGVALLQSWIDSPAANHGVIITDYSESDSVTFDSRESGSAEYRPKLTIWYQNALEVCGDDNVDPGEDCDDGNSDPGDCCSATCQYESFGSACDDGVGCTEGDACDGAGTCQTGTPNDANCDDADVCTGVETCDSVLDCQAGTPLDPDDGVSCTDDSCDPVTGIANVANDANCDDSDVCTGVETCDALLDCQAGTPLDPDDGVPCTDDSCDPVTGIANVANDANCDDSDVCTGVETCDALLDCQAGTPLDPDDGVPCTDDSCDPVTGVANVANDANCDDADVCNGAETCDALLDCQAGTPLDPDDGVACTDDSCDPVTGVANVPNDAFCDNGLFCDGAESCDLFADCQAGAAPCDDGVGCTLDSCDEGSDSCSYVPSDALCSNGLFCDGVETCDALADCQAGAAPCNDGVGCTLDNCDEGGDSCSYVPSDALCDDADVCTGVETCDAVLDCQAGTPLDPDDGVLCTVDSCDPITGIANLPTDSLCDDNDVCTGTETCDAVAGCQAGTPLDPDDGVSCTDDSCDPVSGIANVPNDALCDNGLFCDGAETCDALLDCQAGTPPTTDDGVACTDDSCDEAGDTVVNSPNDANCDDGNVCTADSCDAVTGCFNDPIPACGSQALSSHSNAQESSTVDGTNTDTFIPGASLPGGVDHLVIYNAGFGGAGTSDEVGARIEFGSTVIGHAADEGSSSGTPEAVRIHQLSGFHVITGNGTDELRIKHQVSSGTSFIKGKGIIAIPLDSVTENSDYWLSVGNGDANEATSAGAFVNVRDVTFNLPDAGDYLVLASMEATMAGGAATGGAAMRLQL
ncbi:MAG: hypothetical protein JRJ84_23460, partial [Deltaproteobacteria bacterium]|nr:hypothetical protein [Deltaproteobacteria bacterium]